MLVRPWLLLPLGVLAAAVGLLPWLLHGGMLPPQNLSASGDPAEQPFVLLPFSQYEVVPLAALLVEGGAVGGLLARLVRGTASRAGRAALLVGAVLLQVVAIGQTVAVVQGLLQQRTESAIYLALLAAGSAASVLLGAAVLLLVSSPSRAAVVAGAALAAPLLPAWLFAFLSGPSGVWFGSTAPVLALPYLAAVGLGLLVAWSGVGSVGRALAAVLAAAALWLGPALVSGLSVAAGTRAYARDPAAMVGLAGRTAASALVAPEVLLPLAVAVLVAVVGIAVRRVAGRRG